MLMKAEVDRLHLGCGLHAPSGWLNVDGSWQVVLARHRWLKSLLVSLRLLPRSQAEIPWSSDVLRLNLCRPLPFANETFGAIYSSHTLEHLYYHDALALLRECHRLLTPGGVCRAVVPDLESIVNQYLLAKQLNNPDAATRLMETILVHDKTRKRGVYGMYHRLTAFHQHKWMYDADSLLRLFETAGFENVDRAECLVSRIVNIDKIEDPQRILDGQGIVVEGVKA
jgi:predicted SAM-dependent methyltransferase